VHNDNNETTSSPLWRINGRDWRQDIRTSDILSHVRTEFGDNVTMPALPGRSGDVVRVRRGRKVVATVSLLEGNR
jgi:hypothetical protein